MASRAVPNPPGYAQETLDVPPSAEALLTRLFELVRDFVAGLIELLQLGYAALWGSQELDAKKNDNLWTARGPCQGARRQQLTLPAGAGQQQQPSHQQRQPQQFQSSQHHHTHHLHSSRHHLAGHRPQAHLHAHPHRHAPPGPGKQHPHGRELHRQLSAPAGGSPVQQQPSTHALRPRVGLLSPRPHGGSSSLLSPRDDLPSPVQHQQHHIHTQQQQRSLARDGMPSPLPSPDVVMTAGLHCNYSSCEALLQPLPQPLLPQHPQLQQAVGGQAQSRCPSAVAQSAAASGAAVACAPRDAAQGGVLEISPHELEVGPVVGVGGFARVYAARWRGADVAVKVLDPEACSRPSAVEEFYRELAVLARVPPHPNLLPLVGACTADGPDHLALVTRFCPRGSLYCLLHSPVGAALGWRQVVGLCLGAARGVAHLHAHGVQHRDLKSGNLLLEADLHVRVADFGLSRLTSSAGAGPLTGGLGTHQWMAPEVLARSTYSTKADTFSFGVVLWECVAREVPYRGMDGVQAALAVMNRGLRPEVPPHTPPPYAALMRACWAAVPEQRPTFDQIVLELEGWVHQMDGGLPPAPPVPTPAPLATAEPPSSPVQHAQCTGAAAQEGHDSEQGAAQES